MDCVESDFKGRNLHKQVTEWWFPFIHNDIRSSVDQYVSLCHSVHESKCLTMLYAKKQHRVEL